MSANTQNQLNEFLENSKNLNENTRTLSQNLNRIFQKIDDKIIQFDNYFFQDGIDRQIQNTIQNISNFIKTIPDEIEDFIEKSKKEGYKYNQDGEITQTTPQRPNL